MLLNFCIKVGSWSRAGFKFYIRSKILLKGCSVKTKNRYCGSKSQQNVKVKKHNLKKKNPTHIILSMPQYFRKSS